MYDHVIPKKIGVPHLLFVTIVVPCLLFRVELHKGLHT